MALPPKWYQFLISVFASLGSFLYGYDLGVIAEVVASPSFASKFKADDVQSGLVVSMFTTGAFFGAGLAGPSGDWLGRRKTIALGALIFVLGGSLQTGAQNIHFLWAGRFLAGLGVGKSRYTLERRIAGSNGLPRLLDYDRAALPGRACTP